MNWRQINANCLESEDRQWVIAKYWVRGEWCYQLIRLGSPSESLLIASSAHECKAVCESSRAKLGTS